jgi:hypothetical protein
LRSRLDWKEGFARELPDLGEPESIGIYWYSEYPSVDRGLKFAE